ncbi:hypothetical protein GCM10022631_09490 [Deinococcus rubellus]|uniref:hypothetical protein n=1 Tax=Deinococcus rubellus TaxID=1889240 RepID=UPI0031E81AA7
MDAVRAQVLPGIQVRGIVAAPSITRAAALTLERLALEFKAVTALPTAQEQAAQPQLF